VICAYPISPQTHIVEACGELVKSGELQGCEYINVESEFAALSVAIGASAAGARAYTATASQGLLFMAEAVYNASGLGLPIVMTIGNRAIGAPINIWNDHSDSMSMRDAGWIQLFAETNQEAVDLHVQAFALAERLSCPVMVCMDGFILTHAYERLEIPDQAAVDAFLPPFQPRQVLDPAAPYSIGAMVGPEAFTEVRYLAHDKQIQALDVIPEIHEAFKEQFGRESGGLFHCYHVDGAATVVVTLGSLAGTLKDAVDELRQEGPQVGVITLSSYRPFPSQALRQALAKARRVIVVEKCLAPGFGGIVSTDLRMALQGVDCHVKTVIAGLGGRPVTRPSLQSMLRRALKGELADLHFLDLNRGMVDRELANQRRGITSGPIAENLLKDVAIHGGAD
ncbi:MAG: transketolase C-terminal domain-containing protein, partial [Pseudomonadota bacterium]